jgi:HCOMODA/2-hydroxy-3-carboxy-muconic semialdehyde decarboxylase
MDTLTTCLRDLVIANRILAREGVVDAFGHISVRHPENPERFLLSRSRAPELITRDDILEFTLDGEPIDLRGHTPYGERFIHGAVLEARPDVNSVVHNHSHEVIPFAVTRTTPLRAIAHTCAVIGADIPTWDIRDRFGGGDMLVVNMEQGRDLAATLGNRAVALMRGHGCTVAARNIKEAVNAAVYLQVNAKLQMQALQLGEPAYLTPEEVEAMTARQASPLAMDRVWDYWVARAGCSDM